MNKDLVAIFEYMEREKGIKREVVISAIEESLRTAAKKSVQGVANVSVHINAKTGDIDVLSEREIVETVQDPSEEISLEDARLLDPDSEIGQVIDVTITPKDFGRIAAQSARQIIAQKLRGAERDVIFEEYRHRIHEIVSGTVKRFSKGINLIVDLGKVEAILPGKHYPKTERYQVGDKIHALLLDVADIDNGGAEVVLSRTDPEFVRQLFINEVPEMNEGIVTIEKVVRDPGYRTKILVHSSDPKVDPVGACVGVRGTRVKNIVRELNNEKVDIIPYSEDAIEILQNALAPIEIRKLSVNEENGEQVISIVVDDKDFAVVIGKRGMNAKLNGDLIGYKLEVQRMSDYSKAMAVWRIELAEADDPSLDEPLQVEGINTLIIQNLVAAGLDTERKVLKQTPDELAKIPGISLDMAYTILEKVSKKRK